MIKTGILFLAAAVIAVAAIGGGPGHPEKYCAKLKDGKLVVMHRGMEMTAEAVLGNGTRVMTDGTVVKKDGSRQLLKVGECVDKDGNIMQEKDAKDKDMGKEREMGKDKEMGKEKDKGTQQQKDNTKKY